MQEALMRILNNTIHRLLTKHDSKLINGILIPHANRELLILDSS